MSGLLTDLLSGFPDDRLVNLVHRISAVIDSEINSNPLSLPEIHAESVHRSRESLGFNCHDSTYCQVCNKFDNADVLNFQNKLLALESEVSS